MRTLQIIVGAMALGAGMFGAVSVFVRATSPGEPFTELAEGQTLTYVAIGFAVLAAVLRMIVPGQVVAAGGRRIATGKTAGEGGGRSGMLSPALLQKTGDVGRLMGVYATRTIIAGALLEGAALLCIVAYLAEGSLATIIVGALMVLGIVTDVPTWPRVEQWLNEQLRMLEAQRGLQPQQ